MLMLVGSCQSWILQLTSYWVTDRYYDRDVYDFQRYLGVRFDDERGINFMFVFDLPFVFRLDVG